MYVIIYQPDLNTTLGREIIGPFPSHDLAYDYMASHDLPITGNGVRYIEELTAPNKR